MYRLFLPLVIILAIAFTPTFLFSHTSGFSQLNNTLQTLNEEEDDNAIELEFTDEVDHYINQYDTENI